MQAALLATLAWQTEGKTFARKLSTVRFIARCFRDHLERLFAIEEHDGYMAVALDECPHLSGKIDTLRREHDVLREEIRSIMPQLERVLPTDHAQFQTISKQLRQLIKRLDRHAEQENDLIQEALLRENGVGD
jgi:hemerythrin-like domain-containing protein